MLATMYQTLRMTPLGDLMIVFNNLQKEMGGFT
jgi:hypothetical protein